MDYHEWNDAIAAYFFHPAMSGKRVYLYVTSDLIERIGHSRNVGVKDFVKTTKAGRGFAQRLPSTFEGAYKWISSWRSMKAHLGLVYPPYISHLALAVLAAGHGDDGEFSTAAYYPRLRDLLGEGHSTGPYPGFELLDEVWEDLEHWSCEDLHGEWGVFQVHRAGHRIHVDIPFAQTLLADREREALHRIFASAGFHPALPPSESQLSAIVLAKGKHTLRPRTLRLLEDSKQDSAFRSALLETISEELSGWDGSIPPPPDVSATISSKEVWKRGGIAVCLTTSPLGSITFHLRCNAGNDIAPNEGWELEYTNGILALCEEDIDGWSTILKQVDGKAIDGASFDWQAPLELKDMGRGMVFTMPGSPLRLFTNGAPLMLSGYIETRQLSLGVPFYAAVSCEQVEKLMRWGQQTCDSFQEVLDVSPPRGWRLFKASAAHDFMGTSSPFEQLSMPDTIKLSLIGGVKLGTPFEYFDFAPPAINIQSSIPVDVQCNGHLLGESLRSAILSIPTNLAASSGSLLIEAIRGKDVVRVQRCTIHHHFDPSNIEITRWFDKFGELLQDHDSHLSFAGGLVHSDGRNLKPFNTLPELPELPPIW